MKKDLISLKLFTMSAILLIMANQTFAATGEILSDPHHLVIESGTTGTSTISWTTSGAASASIYVSMDGGSETLFASGTSGLSNATWIQAERIYVFNLYEGLSNDPNYLLDWVSVTSHNPPNTQFGFVYWPQYSDCSVLTNANWTTSIKREVERDLDYMASCSGNLFRIMFWPHKSGYKLYTNGNGGYFTSDCNEIKNNLDNLLGFYAERGLKIYIAFGNNYLTQKNDNDPNFYHWEIAYGTDFDQFKLDSFAWINGIITAVENSTYASSVIYYNLQTEIYDGTPRIWEYMLCMLRNCDIPKGKYCLNLLRWHSHADEAAEELDGWRFDYVDFHCYPDLVGGHDDDPNEALEQMELYFPDSTVVIGESGGMGPEYASCSVDTKTEPSTESTQQTTELDLAQWALDEQIPYFCHWMPWDETPDNCNQIAGWAYDPNSPKDVMGGMVDILTNTINPDMEVNNGGIPYGWSGGSSNSSHEFNRYVNPSQAAANSAYARLKLNTTPASAWIGSSLIEVLGGKKVFVNSYIRSSLKNVSMNIAEYNSSQQWIRSQTGPAFTPSGWAWKSYVHCIDQSAVFTTHSDARYIVVTIGGSSDETAPRYLDVDCVSVWQP